MRRIRSLDDVLEGLEALAVADPRLVAVRASAGQVPLRLLEPGFATLASVVVSQQVSLASAKAIFGRLTALIDPLTAEGVLAAGPDTLRQAGLSRPKMRTLEAMARLVAAGELDLAHIEHLPSEEAVARLVAVPGIGPWTAESYLLFAVGHPDVFPSRDLALQVAAADALGLPARPDHAALARIASSWSPWRGVAARLLWAHYAAMRGREAVPAAAASRKVE